MLKYKQNYKQNISNMEKIKNKLAEEHQERRKNRRSQNFERNRNILPCSSTQKDTRKTRILQREIERKRKTAESQNKKPPFVVGIVRHHFFSPLKPTEKKITNVRQTTIEKRIYKQSREKVDNKKEKGITKATEKRLQAKVAKAAPATSTDVRIKVSFASPAHKFKPPIGLPKVALETQVTDDVSKETDKILTSNTSNCVSSSTAVQKSEKYKKQATLKTQSLTLLSVSSKNTETSDQHDDKKCIVNVINMCNTPFETDKRASRKKDFKKCYEERSANKKIMHTSTPLDNKISKSGQLSILFITMKVNKLCNKAIQTGNADLFHSWNNTILENTVIAN